MASNRKVPSVADVKSVPDHVMSAWEAGAVRDSRDSQGAQREASEEELDPRLAEALDRARNGDDSMLMPYQPTPSINPPRPRTLAAGYDRKTMSVYVRFRGGAVYVYRNVPPNVWNNMKRWVSIGRGINRTLNNYPYERLWG